MKNLVISNELKQYLDNGEKLVVLDGLCGWAIIFVILFHCNSAGPDFFPFFHYFSENSVGAALICSLSFPDFKSLIFYLKTKTTNTTLKFLYPKDFTHLSPLLRVPSI